MTLHTLDEYRAARAAIRERALRARVADRAAARRIRRPLDTADAVALYELAAIPSL